MPERGVFCVWGKLEGELKEMVNRITQRSVTPECGVFCGELEGELKELVDCITQRSVTPERGVFCGELEGELKELVDRRGNGLAAEVLCCTTLPCFGQARRNVC